MKAEVVDRVEDPVDIEEPDPSPLDGHLPRGSRRELIDARDRNEFRHHLCDLIVQEGQMTERLKDAIQKLKDGEEGAMGYILAWAMGVPVSVLFLIFLLRGCR